MSEADHWRQIRAGLAITQMRVALAAVPPEYLPHVAEWLRVVADQLTPPPTPSARVVPFSRR